MDVKIINCIDKSLGRNTESVVLLYANIIFFITCIGFWTFLEVLQPNSVLTTPLTTPKQKREITEGKLDVSSTPELAYKQETAKTCFCDHKQTLRHTINGLKVVQYSVIVA